MKTVVAPASDFASDFEPDGDPRRTEALDAVWAAANWSLLNTLRSNCYTRDVSSAWHVKYVYDRPKHSLNRLS